MKLPSPVRERTISLLDWLDEFYWAWRVSRPLRSENCEIHETREGTQILPLTGRRAGRGGAAASTLSLVVSDASTEDDGDRFRVSYGTINGVVLNDMHAGDVPFKYIPITLSSGFFFATGIYDADTFQWPETDIYTQATAIKPNTDTEAYLVMGGWATVDGRFVIVQEIYGPVELDECDLNFAP